MLFDTTQPAIVWESSEPKSRETLYLEQNNSPLLAAHYENWKQGLSSKETDLILLDLSCYLRNQVFDLRFCHRNIIESIVHQNPSEEISIELFVQQKAGLCRHFAFAAYYFLEKIRLEGILPIDSIQLVRKILSIHGVQGKHVWLCISLNNENRSFHFDPFWGMVIDSTVSDAKEILRDTYGL
ncbi:MAG: hypothetical protein KGZ39_02890 [Simkania sp.]|nr:hypothetical protein [Simkania sp.]